MKKITGNSFACSLLMCVAAGSFAQSKPTAPKQRIESKPVSAVPAKPIVAKFSMASVLGDAVSADLNPMPIEDLVRAVEEVIPKRGEFESAADFYIREAGAASGKLLGNLNIDDLLVLNLPISKSTLEVGGYKYEPDSQVVSLLLGPAMEHTNGIGAPSALLSTRSASPFHLYKLKTVFESERSYSASNVYGATVQVSSKRINRFGIAAKQSPFLKSDPVPFSPSTIASFTLDNAVAAKELPVLKAVLVMQLEYPRVVYNFNHLKPTRENPSEFNISEKFLFGKIISVVFYSGLTGKIFARVPDSVSLTSGKDLSTAPRESNVQAPAAPSEEAIVERMALSMQCHPRPVAARSATKPSYNEYFVYCANGPSLTFQCSQSSCRVLKNI